MTANTNGRSKSRSIRRLNQATVPDDVAAAWGNAANVFENCEPADFARTRGRNNGGNGCAGASAGDLIGWASLLDQYNNGDIGPGHCSEDSSSDD